MRDIIRLREIVKNSSDMHLITPWCLWRVLGQEVGGVQGCLRMLRKIFESKEYRRNLVRLFRDSAAGNLISVPLDYCVNQYAFSYGKKGWHYWKQIVLETMENSDQPISDMSWYRFIQQCECNTYSEMMSFHSDTELSENIPFGFLSLGDMGCRHRNGSFCFYGYKAYPERTEFYVVRKGGLCP
jgi:hypothetical protein